MTRKRSRATLLPIAVCLMLVAGCGGDEPVESGEDEAKRAGRAPETFPAADEDYFGAMDRGVSLLAPEAGGVPAQYLQAFVKGRNNWNVWTGGNDRLWDHLASNSFGTLDFLKTLSSHDSLEYSRDNRWAYLGLVNEPCFVKATGPDPERYDLWLDRRIENADCPPDPFANAEKYPGVQIGARGDTVPVGSYYGEPSGIVGLRLFPNPDFDEEAAADWDAEAYYNDETYYARSDLVRPYRVGMSCGFCHIGPSPTNPPDDFENPEWANLNSNPGAQYFWIDRIFFWEYEPVDNFIFQLFHTQLPGSLDTSLVSSDNINNPRTMNAIYSLKARLEAGRASGRETLGGGGVDNKQFNDYPAVAAVPLDPPAGSLGGLFESPDTVYTTRVLKDGADSVGALGALNRVYLNIGLASEEWLKHFTPLIGATPTMGPITPIEISVLREKSNYWLANEEQTADVGVFFYLSAQPDYLADAPGGPDILAAGAATATAAGGFDDAEAMMAHGKEVFADTCARCHSSKIPVPPPEVEPAACAGGGTGPGYLDCWNRYWQWTKTDEFKTQMREVVNDPEFLINNFLSTERRVPVTLLQTNACSPLATNAIEGNIWDNFSSQSYKELVSVGSVTIHDPLTGAESQFTMPGGGRGYTRPASLTSVWSTAPLLLNNSLGRFDGYGTVDGRMASFEDSIQKLLWPERRKTDAQRIEEINAELRRRGEEEIPPTVAVDVPGYIQRTTSKSYLKVAAGYLPDPLKVVLRLFSFLPFFADDMLEIGPIPAGTPVGLLANLGLLSEDRSLPARAARAREIISLVRTLKGDLLDLGQDASDAEARAVFRDAVPKLIELSNCPDYVVNRGHYFGTNEFYEAGQEPGLTDADKTALIEFLRTL